MPHRRCVGCGRVAPKPTLLRLALRGDEVVADPGARRPGRGAYVCATGDCLVRATRRGGLARSFRRRVNVSPETLELGT